MKPNRALTFTLCLIPVLAASAQSGPTLSIDAGANQHPINVNIYGIVSYGLDTGFAQEIKVPNVRWGGDATTRYNWEVDSSNAGFDWFFMGGNGQSNPVPGASADAMVRSYGPAGSLITIPIIPFVNKSASWNCSFSVSVYGPQQSTNPYVHPNGDTCGNSLSPSGTQLTDTNIYANHVDNSASLQQGWVQHLVSTFGTAAQGGVPFYQLDNEPFGWGNTHRDVEPNGATYSTIVALGQQYATMVKSVDPSAAVMGPSDFTLGGWIGNTSQQNGLFAGQYYLQQMAAYDQTRGSRSLDYFDEHYYPQFSDPASQLASTRTLWDPTFNGGTWVEQYFFNGPMQLIPRFHSWINQYYPGTKLSLSEYSIDSGNKLITDALAEADMLGIFGREGLDFANMWIPPAPTDPIAFSFRLYRNYDGNGSRFGETSVSATSSDQSQLAVYAAKRSSDGALTLVVLNKSTVAIQTTLSLANFVPASLATAYSYSGVNLKQIVSSGSAAVVGNILTYSYPAYSATVFELHNAPATLTPALAWKTPNAITSTTPLSVAQLNASASVPGTFTYSPAAGAVLSAGTQTLSVMFTPTNGETYKTATRSISINVLQATQTVLSVTRGPNVVYPATLMAKVRAVGGGPISSGTVTIYTAANSPLVTLHLTNGSVSWPINRSLSPTIVYGTYTGTSSTAASRSAPVNLTTAMAEVDPKH